MASREQIARFAKKGGVGYTIPYHKDIPHEEIRLWSPDPDSGEDYTLEMILVKKDPKDENSYVGKYVNPGSGWDQTVKDFFAEIEMEYLDKWKAMGAAEIPQHLFDKFGWRIAEFGLAHMDYGNLIARIKWEKDAREGLTETYITAYSWPPC